MTHIYDIIAAVANEPSKNKKIELLQAEAKNPLLARYLQITYNPRFNFYQTKVDVSDKAWMSALAPGELEYGKVEFDDAFMDLITETLCERKMTGGTAKTWLSHQHRRMNEKDQKILEWMIMRDVRAGFSESTINKVWPDLIEVLPYMRCSLPKDSDPKEWFDAGEEVISQLKADGMFINFNVQRKVDIVGGDRVVEDWFEVRSRNGSTFPPSFFKKIADTLINKFQCIEKMQFQGEMLVVEEYGGGWVLPREQGNGILNSILQEGDSHTDKKFRLQFVVWDVIPLAQAKKKAKIATKYKERLETLVSAFGTDRIGSDVYVIETEYPKTIEEAKDHYSRVRAEGGEGTIVKKASAPWIDGTSKDLVKLKVEAVVDLLIVGYRPGEGKRAATFGSVLCQSADGLLEVGVSGFTEEMLQYIHMNRDFLIHKIMAVKCNGVMKPSAEGQMYSLFLPRFVELRADKTVADTLQQIQDQCNA